MSSPASRARYDGSAVEQGRALWSTVGRHREGEWSTTVDVDNDFVSDTYQSSPMESESHNPTQGRRNTPEERRQWSVADPVSVPAKAATQHLRSRSRQQSGNESRTRSRSCSRFHKNERDALLPFQKAIVHTVQLEDTLQRLAVRYQIEIPYILRANRLWMTDSLHSRNYLLVPISAYRSDIERYKTVDLLRDDLTEYLQPKAQTTTSAQHIHGLSAVSPPLNLQARDSGNRERQLKTADRAESGSYFTAVDTDITDALSKLSLLHKTPGLEAAMYNPPPQTATRSSHWSTSDLSSSGWTDAEERESFSIRQDVLGHAPSSTGESSHGLSRHVNIGTRQNDICWTDADHEAQVFLEKTSFQNFKKTLKRFKDRQLEPALRQLSDIWMESRGPQTRNLAGDGGDRLSDSRRSCNSARGIESSSHRDRDQATGRNPGSGSHLPVVDYSGIAEREAPAANARSEATSEWRGSDSVNDLISFSDPDAFDALPGDVGASAVGSMGWLPNDPFAASSSGRSATPVGESSTIPLTTRRSTNAHVASALPAISSNTAPSTPVRQSHGTIRRSISGQTGATRGRAPANADGAGDDPFAALAQAQLGSWNGSR